MNRRDFWKLGLGSAATVAGAGGLGRALAAEAAEPASAMKPMGCKKADPDAKADAEAMAKSAVKHLLPGKRTCGEAVLASGCEALGVRCKMVPDIALGLGGGIGFQGKLCAVVSGGAMVLSLAVAARESEYKNQFMRTMKACGAWYKACEKQFGTCSCRELSGLDLTKPEDRKKLKAHVKADKCAKIVAAGAKLLAEQINKA